MSDEKKDEGSKANEMIQCFASMMNFTMDLVHDYQVGKVKETIFINTVRALSVLNNSGKNIIRVAQAGPSLEGSMAGVSLNRIQNPALEMIKCPMYESLIYRQNCLDVAESRKHPEWEKCPEKKITETLLLGEK